MQSGLPLVATGDVHMHLRSRKPLQDTLTAIRHNTTVAAAGHALQPNAERHLRTRAALASIYPPELLAETQRIADRFAQIIVESRTAATATPQANTGGRAALLFNPGALYGQAAVRLAGSEGPDTDSVTVAEFELLMRMTAAKIRAGDRTYIVEALLGQAVWLQALSTQISTYMLKVNDKQKIALGGLLVKAQTTTIKTLTALAGISTLDAR